MRTIAIGDQIWLDLNDDGSFDRISEQFNVASTLDIRGQRYSLRTDRLGHGLLLTPNQNQGQLQFKFSPTGLNSKVSLLEGALRDENGLFIAIRLGSEPMSVPVGRYRIENLVVEVEDPEQEKWRLTLIARTDTFVEFSVETDKLTELKLLEKVTFAGNVKEHAPRYLGHTTSIEPFICTDKGLVVTDFTRIKPGEVMSEMSAPRDATSARFRLVSNDTGYKSEVQCSGFN